VSCSHGALYKVLGELDARQGSVEMARAVLSKGLERDPSYAPLYHASAILESQYGNLEVFQLSNLHPFMLRKKLSY